MSIRLSYSLRARLLFFLLAAIAVGALAVSYTHLTLPTKA